MVHQTDYACFYYIPKKYDAFPELCTPLMRTETMIIQASAKHNAK